VYEREKAAVARAGAQLVEAGMRVGLGSGSTVTLLVEALAELRPDATYVAASLSTESAARAAGLQLAPLDEVGELDLALDGSDQVDDAGWLVKGGGAAHTREKIVAAAARRFVVLVSSDKLVARIGPPVPLEVLAFAPGVTLARIGDARLRPETPPSPDGGLIADSFGAFDDPRALAARLDATPGVVAHGLFAPETVERVLVARGETVSTLERATRARPLDRL
jgi:ribose 5-phosphate isomerase A